MNNATHQFQQLAANLGRLRERMVDLPISGILLTRLLLHLGRGISGMLEHKIRPFGLTETEFRVLTTLFAQPDGSAHPTDLCIYASQSPANMSRISDSLVSRDLITRISSRQDRRKMVLRVTTAGEELVQTLLPQLYGPVRAMFKDFSEEQQQALIAQLQALAAKLEQAPSHQASL